MVAEAAGEDEKSGEGALTLKVESMLEVDSSESSEASEATEDKNESL